MDNFDILECYLTEALSESYSIKAKPIKILIGSDSKDFMLYFGMTNDKTKGDNLLTGWTSFAFIGNTPIDKSSVGSRIMGRRVIMSQSKSFSEILKMNKEESKIGKYNALLDSKESDTPFVFDTNLFPGKWAIFKDTRSKTELIWLVRKK